jgi:hypothetical protein
VNCPDSLAASELSRSASREHCRDAFEKPSRRCNAGAHHNKELQLLGNPRVHRSKLREAFKSDRAPYGTAHLLALDLSALDVVVSAFRPLQPRY